VIAGRDQLRARRLAGPTRCVIGPRAEALDFTPQARKSSCHVIAFIDYHLRQSRPARSRRERLRRERSASVAGGRGFVVRDVTLPSPRIRTRLTATSGTSRRYVFRKSG
jgi:hypothetical protein